MLHYDLTKMLTGGHSGSAIENATLALICLALDNATTRETLAQLARDGNERTKEHAADVLAKLETTLAHERVLNPGGAS